MPALVETLDVILAALQGEREDIHTAMPGKVVKYYPDKQTADVQPMLKRPVFDTDDNRLQGESLPVLPNVPVIFPRGGGFIIHVPLAPGDFVWVMFSEGGTGEFRQTGQESEPFDVSRHTITYPYCVPGAVPDTKASTDSDVTAGTKMVVGKEGDDARILFSPGTIEVGAGATDYAALASKVDSAISTIVTHLNACLAVLFPPAGPAGTPVATLAPVANVSDPIVPPTSVAAAVAKVK